MLYLLIVVALCLLVPSLPYWTYRWLPRRPSPPLSEGQLHRLATELQREGSQTISAAVLVPDNAPDLNVLSPDSSVPDAPARAVLDTRSVEEERQQANRQTDGNRRRAVSRLTIPSYTWANVFWVTVFIGMMLALSAAWMVLFDYLGENHARMFQPAVFVFTPFSYGMLSALPAAMLGICTAAPLTFLLMRLVLGRSRFNEYLFWEEGRAEPKWGVSVRERYLTVFSCMGCCLSILCVLYVWQTMNWYARVQEDGIAIKRLLDVREHVYPYNSVEQITLTSGPGPNGGPVPNLRIQFRDGQVWETDTTFALPPSPERDRLLDFLRRKTGQSLLLLSFTPR
ncbi:MAG TPA: hypothetical protein VN688_26855 [Gemmataceae bacterium]|nr:hypothetical protein [Gemmataceae bacterium]